MQCPVCDDRMKEIERSGVTIDICPSCKGVWLDRGELDKLISLSVAHEGGVPEEQPRESRPEPAERAPDGQRYHDNERDRDEYRHPHHEERARLKDAFRGHQKRKGSWLADILEGIGGD